LENRSETKSEPFVKAKATVASRRRLGVVSANPHPMAIKLNELNDGRLVDMEVTGKLHKSDYEHFVPEFERLVKQHGKLRVLFLMKDFHGWDPGAFWKDIKFDVRHLSDIERVAVVGDKTWEEAMTEFCEPFTKAKISYFEQHRLAEARMWLGEGLTPVKSRTPHAPTEVSPS
jgi:hypothetical protein